MRKTIKKIICFAAATVTAAGLGLAAGCGNWTADGVTPDDYSAVTSNGGFAVQTDNYVYFINGYELNTADNTFGKPLKGSIQRISVEDVAARNYTAAQTVVPLVAYSTHYQAGIYIYGDRIYYSTPSTARNSSGEIQNSNLEFKSSSLDGTETMSEYYFRSENLSLPYRYVRPEADGAVYLMYAASESLYGESTAVTNIHSINTSTGENTLLAYNVSEYMFDTSDPENPYVFYTMAATYLLGSDNHIDEGYNQLYMVRADATEANEYDFSYVSDYDAEEDPLYVNCGDLVYDGIGSEAYANRYSQFNYGYGSGESYTINRSDSTYELSFYRDGVLNYTVQQSLDAAAGLYEISVSDIDSDSDGAADAGWNAITANDTAALNAHRLLITDDEVEYIPVSLGGEQWVLYAADSGLELGKLTGGKLSDEFAVTNSGKPTILDVREETTAAESGEGTVTHTYVYYSLDGGNGYTFNRIALSTDPDNYRPNKLPYEDVYTYSEVKILDLDACSDWYMPEFVGNTILFASETEGMSSYNYIMACDLSSEDGDMMSNAELNAYNEKYEAVADEIAEYDEETNSDGTEAYQYLSDALTYAFYTGDSEYLAELIQAYVDIQGEDEEYLYSVRSAEIYIEFCNATGDWAAYADDVRTVNGEQVHANRQQYYYALFGSMTEEDEDGLLQTLRGSYMQSYPQDTSTWWTKMGTAWQIVFIIAMCVVGLAVIAGIVILVIWLVRRSKSKNGDEGAASGRRIDITDDKDIDVYSDEN